MNSNIIETYARVYAKLKKDFDREDELYYNSEVVKIYDAFIQGWKTNDVLNDDDNKHLESVESLISTIQLVVANLNVDISGKGYATILNDAVTKYRQSN